VTGATPISPSASTPSRAAASRAYATWVSVRRSRCQCGLVGSGCGVRCRCVTVRGSGLRRGQADDQGRRGTRKVHATSEWGG
jgi:hypothetical protein